MDRFQEDMFEVFEHVRHRSRTDSQVFEDSVELQLFFIKRRDELCKNGEVLSSPALQYSEADLQASVETLRAQKLPREQQEAELEIKQEKVMFFFSFLVVVKFLVLNICLIKTDSVYFGKKKGRVIVTKNGITEAVKGHYFSSIGRCHTQTSKRLWKVPPRITREKSHDCT